MAAKLEPPSEEARTWALAYSIAVTALVLGSAIRDGVNRVHPLERLVDEKAAAIADRVTKRLKGKLR